jgi:hypothetical protein
MVCALRWTDPHLAAVSTATPSDCIEACNSYNTPRNGDKKCLGATFVPDWWNQTVAMEEKGRPFNCFLMSNMTVVNKNDKNYEIVSLCLDKDACRRYIN